MTVKALQDVLDRIPTWSVERQEHAAEVLAAIESDGDIDASAWGIRDADLAEIRRRLVDRDEPTMTLDELDEKLRPLIG